MKILSEIGTFLKETALPILLCDFDKLSEISGIRSLYFPNSFSYRKHLYALKRRNYIQQIKTKNGKGIALTLKGKIQILKYRLKFRECKKPWDGKWRAICWDIPEITRQDRDYLRRLLRWVGFVEMHKSFWIFPFDTRKELQELVTLYKKNLSGDIRFLTIEEIKEDEDLEKKFVNLLRS